MSRLAVLFCAFVFILTSGGAAFGDEPKLILQLNDNQGTFAGTSSSYEKKGGQNLAYYTVSYMSPSYGLAVMGATSDTSYQYTNVPGKTDFQLATMMDSTVSGYYVFPKWRSTTLRIGLDLNAPTGHASLTLKEQGSISLSRVMSELVMMPSFGRGFAWAPNLSIVQEYGSNMVGGLGVRYESSGEYTPTPQDPTNNMPYKPGDTLMFFGSLQYAMEDANQFFLSLAAIIAAKDKQGGVEVLQLGNMYNFGLRYIHTGSQDRTTYSATYGWQDRNLISSGAGGLSLQDRNANNNNADLFAQNSRMMNAKFALNTIAGIKKLFPNGVDATDPYYIGGYTKIYLGAGFTYSASPAMTATFDLRGYRLWNGADNSGELSATTYTGASVDLGFVYTFGGQPTKPAEPQTQEVPQEGKPAEEPSIPAPPAPVLLPPVTLPLQPPSQTPMAPGPVPQVVSPLQPAAPEAPPSVVEPEPTPTPEPKKPEQPEPPKKLPAPENVSSVVADGVIYLGWEAVKGASYYYVYKSKSRSFPLHWYYIGKTKGVKFKSSRIDDGRTYYYGVAAVAKDGRRGLISSPVAATKAIITHPPSMLMTEQTGPAEVLIKWKKSAGAEKYFVYRSEEAGTHGDYLGEAAENSYTDKELAPGATYYYEITAVNMLGESEYSPQISITLEK